MKLQHWLSSAMKMFVPMFMIVAVALTAMVVIPVSSFRMYYSEGTKRTLLFLGESVKGDILEAFQRTEGATAGVRHDDVIVREMRSGNREALSAYVEETLSVYGVSYMVITDIKGTCILRTYDFDSHGDNVSHLVGVQAALRGEIYSLFESVGPISGAAITTSPIYDANGVTVGTVSVGSYLFDNSLIDPLHDNYGAECSIVFDGVRIATTIRDENGERAIGTTADQKLLEQAKSGKPIFSGRIILPTSGKNGEYEGYYLPLDNPNGTSFVAIGVFEPVSNAAQTTMNFTLVCSGLGIIVLVVFGIWLYAMIAQNKTIKQDHERQRITFEQSPQFVGAFDRDLKLMSLNGNAMKLFGYESFNEARQSIFTDINGWVKGAWNENREPIPFESRVKEVFDTGTLRYRVKMDIRGEKKVWLDIAGVKIPEGDDYQVTFFCSDITELQDALYSVREAEQEAELHDRIRSAVFNVSDPVIVLVDGHEPMANKGYDSLLPGWEKCYRYGQPFSEIEALFERYTSDKESQFSRIDMLRKTGVPQEGPWHFRADGAVPERIIYVRGAKFDTGIDGGGEAEIWLHHDITYMQTALDTAVRNEHLLSLTNEIGAVLFSRPEETWQETVSDAVDIIREATDADRASIWKRVDIDGEAYITRAISVGGENGTRNFAVGEQLQMSHVLPEWVNDDIADRYICENVDSYPYPALGKWIRDNTGAESMTLLPLMVNGKMWGVMGLMFDTQNHFFTEYERKILWQAGLNCANAIVLSERTSALLDALQQAQAANLAKSVFLSRMSHEIRTPLNAVIGMTAIGLNAAEDERKDYAFDKIKEASNHLLGVVNDILDISKIEADKLELSETEFDLEAVKNRLINMFAFRAESESLDFTCSLDDRVENYFLGDEQRFTQVIVNLVSNAVKFTPKNGSISLDIKLVKEFDGKALIESRITDSGIGIEPSKMLNIFNAFEQADNSVARKYGGTGLGLAISKRIALLMDGDVTVTSEEGKGSVFTFTATLGVGKRIASADADNADNEAADIVQDEFLGKAVLIAEDVEINQIVVQALLEDTGVAIDFADNGKVAAEKFARNTELYDMIFMDVHMPEVDGFEATRRIRALPEPRAKTVPIVAMTADVFREDIEKCLESGMNSHVGKPLDLPVVIKIMRRYLSDSNGEGI
ncbi:MAG: response regulator [Oscillospiraceae bacterium]|jgi:signal transduction histidine kinase/CheY-like chemotaxis protein/PAS domain-containing protein|nr:response regulator [Oscillospiraceae bacterium]